MLNPDDGWVAWPQLAARSKAEAPRPSDLFTHLRVQFAVCCLLLLLLLLAEVGGCDAGDD